MKKFEGIVAERFKIPAAGVTDAMTSKDVPEWDSMNYLLFISELEENFNIVFTMDEVMSAQSLGDIRRMLSDKGASV